MKKLFFVLIFVFSILLSYSQKFVKLNNTGSKSEILLNSEDRFVFKTSFDGFYILETNTNNSNYNKILVNGFNSDGNLGYPELPVMSKLIEMPVCEEVEIKVLNYDEQIIHLNDFAPNHPIIPNQPSISRSQAEEDIVFQIAESIYSDKKFYQPECVKVENLGTMRGVKIAQIIVNPFSYDIESNVLTIKNNLEIEIVFKKVDLVKTESKKTDKYSPLFENFYSKLWNYNTIKSKSNISKFPIKYVIVSDRMFEEELIPFIEWKTKKGFEVITAYTDEIGKTKEKIKAYLQSLYDTGTENNPPPTYLLIVGDVAQVPSYSGNGHLSDMYYCEFDGNGDYIPEMYFGRFSATDIEQLRPQIEKTLMYEQYTFPEPSFLGNAVLVSGVDRTNSAIICNGQINYINTYYVNVDHGVDASVYLYPESGSKKTEIIQDINSGTGFVNYTAHCNSYGWSDPKFSTDDIPDLENENQYFFSIGNCCKSNKFDVGECFGESLLRADKKGAVIHIGGSDDTYWYEDYYWSVGLIDDFSANPTYEETGLGAFDHLFHENEEEPYITAGQMVFIGNYSVSQSTSDLKQYYWEIYHIMGDPSVMPYIGEASELQVEYDTILPLNSNSVTITTESDVYVALSIEGVLLDVKSTDTDGLVLFEFDELPIGTTIDVVLTKQFKIPHIGKIEILQSDYNTDVILRKISAPVQEMHISESTFKPAVEFTNLGNSDLNSVVVGYYIGDEEPVELTWTGTLSVFETTSFIFPEISLHDGMFSFTAYVKSPNNINDENPENNQITITVFVYSHLIELDLLTDKYGNENTWELKDLFTGDILYSGGPYLKEEITHKNYKWQLNSGCYNFTIYDSDGDGMKGSEVGINPPGLVKIINKENDEIILNLEGNNPNFTSKYSFNFCLTPDDVYCPEDITVELTEPAFDLYIALPEGGVYSGNGVANGVFNPQNAGAGVHEITYSHVLNDIEKVCKFYITVSKVNIEDIGYDAIEIFPNPSFGLITVSSEIYDKFDVEIFAISGQLLYKESNVIEKTEIDMSDLQSGSYFVRIISSEQVVTKKIIINK